MPLIVEMAGCDCDHGSQDEHLVQNPNYARKRFLKWPSAEVPQNRNMQGAFVGSLLKGEQTRGVWRNSNLLRILNYEYPKRSHGEPPTIRRTQIIGTACFFFTSFRGNERVSNDLEKIQDEPHQ